MSKLYPGPNSQDPRELNLRGYTVQDGTGEGWSTAVPMVSERFNTPTRQRRTNYIGLQKDGKHSFKIVFFKSNHPQAHKRNCINTLLKKVDTHCGTLEAKKEEISFLIQLCFLKQCYPSYFVQKTQRKRTAGSTVARPSLRPAILYITNISEATARLLKPYAVGSTYRPAGTLHSRQMRIKERVDPSE